MFPSCSRVKLNRVALKDLAGVKLVPRRRRVPSALDDLTADAAKTQNQVERRDVCSSSGDDGPGVHKCVPQTEGPETEVTVAAAADCSGGTIKAKRRRHESRKEACNVETKQEGDSTREYGKNTPPRPTGHAGSEGSLRRAVTPSCCVLCGDCKFVSPRKKTLGKKECTSVSQSPEQSTARSKIKEGHSVTENAKKHSQYPKVTLCDIAKHCDVCSNDCAYVLPDVLKTKGVPCFKRDIRTGFRFRPDCLGPHNPKIEPHVLDGNGKLCPRVQSEKIVCRRQSLTENQRRPKEPADAEILTSRTSCDFLKGRTSEASATCSASLLLGSNKGRRRTSMLDKDVEEVLGPRCDVMGAQICRDKKANLGCSITYGSLPSVPEWANSSWNDTAKTDFSDQEETYSLASGDSQAVCSSYRSTVKENGLQESFTCQRVRPYCGKIQKISFSCARTYMAWPFYNTTRAGGTTTCQAETIHPSACKNSDSAMNENPSGSPSRGTNVMIPNAPTEKEVGEPFVDKRNGKRHGIMLAYSSDRSKNTEFIHRFTDAEEPPASPFSDVTAFSTPSQHGMESDINTGLVSSAPVNEPATDNSVSTSSPSALGLSDWEIATPVPSLFTHGGLSSLFATPPSVPLSLFPPLKVKGVELLEAHSASTSPMSSPKHFIRGVEKPLFHSEEAQMTSCCSSPPSSLVASYISDSFHSRESFLLLPQDNQGSDREMFTERSPPHLKPYNITSSISSSHTIKERGEEDTNFNEFLLPPLLSPVTSPHRHLRARSLTWSHCCSKQEEEEDDDDDDDEEEEVEEINASKPKILPGHDIPHDGEVLEV
ncbi:hypothetical protein JOB18_022909 [Solea senegalensis]|uniref:Uncharacterized protein n=1 Tax=Solea senegalensis TaxID=28829 RepID=A0AAV6PHT6_SOLSE|nr:hypothetical protein JOB18_022909 [Solea senegalensis]